MVENEQELTPVEVEDQRMANDSMFEPVAVQNQVSEDVIKECFPKNCNQTQMIIRL